MAIRMKSKTKLTVLGGGGVRSPFLTKSIALGAEAAGITEVALMDNNVEKLRKYGKIAKLVGERCNPALRFSLTTDPEEAIRDADYIITTIRGDADEGRVFDERTALNHGVLGQETTGAGGFAMALRSIPILTGYCELAKRLAKKDVLIFNFTNPSGLVTQALRTQGYDMVYGVCDAPSGFHKQLAALLGVERERFTMRCWGLNHLSWFDSFAVDGKDVTEKILTAPRLYRDTEMKHFDPELIALSGNLLPNEYLYFYYYSDRAVKSILSSSKTRGETILEINQKMHRALDTIDIDHDLEAAFHCFMLHHAMRENSYFTIETGGAPKHIDIPTVDEFIRQPDGGGYAGVALDFIKARATGEKIQMVLSVPNNGACPYLADEDVMELTCEIDRDGAHPVPVPEIPPMQLNLIRTIKLYENLTVEAILEKSYEKAVKALTVHPLVNSYPVAKSLVDLYKERYKGYIGELS